MAGKRRKNKKSNNPFDALMPKGRRRRGRKNGPRPVKPSTNPQRVVVKAPSMKAAPSQSKVSMREAVCKITDPFCVAAKNAKWPDGQGGGTMTMQIRWHATKAANATTNGYLFHIGASLPFAVLDIASATMTDYTCGAAYIDDTGSSNFKTYANTYRVVTWGIIIRNLLPALTCSGYVTVSRLTKMPALGTVVPVNTLYGSEVQSFPMEAGMEVTVVGKPAGSIARSFQPQNANNTLTLGWDVMRVEFVGLGSTTAQCFDIEFFYNVEFTLADTQTALHQFVTPVIPIAPKAINAANTVSSRVSTIVSGGIDVIGNKIMNAAGAAIEDIFSDALGFLAF